MSRYTALAVLFALIPLKVIAHGGGLDSYGCHNETATGTYHCHQGAYSCEAEQ